MVKVNELYEIEVFPSEWSDIVSQYNSNRKAGRDTVIERVIAGKPVQCTVNGYSWKESRKPTAPQKQKITVQVTEIKET
jgi:hypothetical protein